MILSVYCDGGARGNPGPAAIGVVIKNEDNVTLHKFGKKIGFTTNNVAEYTAVIEGLSWIFKSETVKNRKRINFFLDSELVVSQLNGVYKIKHTKLRNLIMQIRIKEAQAGVPITYTHIPREKNKLADAMVNNALDS